MKTLAACLIICSTLACGGPSPTAPSVVSCSTAALHGAYGSQRNGQTAPGTLLTSVGLATFDGAGHIAEELSVSTNGAFSAIAGQRRGRGVEDFAEAIVKKVFGLNFQIRCSFSGPLGQVAKCDFAIPSKSVARRRPTRS